MVSSLANVFEIAFFPFILMYVTVIMFKRKNAL